MRLLFRLFIFSILGFSQTLNEQLQELEHASKARRVELINRIKEQLILMNQEERLKTIEKMRAKLNVENRTPNLNIEIDKTTLQKREIIEEQIASQEEMTQQIITNQEHLRDVVENISRNRVEIPTRVELEEQLPDGNIPTTTQQITNQNNQTPDIQQQIDNTQTQTNQEVENVLPQNSTQDIQTNSTPQNLESSITDNINGDNTITEEPEVVVGDNIRVDESNINHEDDNQHLNSEFRGR